MKACLCKIVLFVRGPLGVLHIRETDLNFDLIVKHQNQLGLANLIHLPPQICLLKSFILSLRCRSLLLHPPRCHNQRTLRLQHFVNLIPEFNFPFLIRFDFDLQTSC
jgi:hypothetical protein